MVAAGAMNLVLNKIDMAFKPERCISLPRAAIVEPTRRCNLRCRICSRKEFSSLKEGDMGKGLFHEILEKIPTLFYIGFFGWGEPLLNKDLFSMASDARKKAGIIEVFSNGRLVDKPMAGRIASGGITDFWFSVDTLQPEADRKDLQAIIPNIRNLLRARKNRLPMVRLNYVVTKENYLETASFLEAADTLGVDEIAISDVCGDDRYASSGSLRLSREEAGILMKSLGRRGKTRVTLRPRRNRFLEGNFCKYMWSFPFIDWQGNVMRCWHRPESSEHTFGNIKDIKAFNEIWNSPGYISARMSIKSDERPPVCAGCRGKRSPVDTIFGEIY